jgi:hypothetical protein
VNDISLFAIIGSVEPGGGELFQAKVLSWIKKNNPLFIFGTIVKFYQFCQLVLSSF